MIKNKNLKMVLAIALAISLVFAIPTAMLANNGYYEQPLEEVINIELDDLFIIDIFDPYTIEDAELRAEFLETQRIVELQEPAIQAYNVLMDAFLTEVDGVLKLVYPDNYAGAYIDPYTNDTLVIQLTDISREATDFYMNLLGSGAPIAFKEVNFSLNQLIDFGQIVVETLDDVLVTSHGFDTLNNTYHIGLYIGCADSMQTASVFSEMSRFLPIPITFELEGNFEDVDLRGGAAIRAERQNGTFTGSFSVGISGNHSGSPSIITAGHPFVGLPANGNTRVFSGNNHIGNLNAFRAGQHAGNTAVGQGSWAIIHLNQTGQRMMTNQMMNGSRITAVNNTVPVNAVVRGSGHVTNSWTGTVTHVNQSYSTAAINYTGMTRVSTATGQPNARQGDSGAPIYRNISGTITYVGTLSSVGDGMFTGNIFFFSPHQHVSFVRPQT